MIKAQIAGSSLGMNEDTLVLPRQHDAQGEPCALEAEYAACFEMNCQSLSGDLKHNYIHADP
jgi:hypothetical protein